MSLEIYGALLLYKAGKEINENNLKKILEATGAKVDDAKVKALVASLDGVDIDAAIKEAAVVPAAVSIPIGSEKKVAEKKIEEEKKSTDEAAAGLSSLFG